MAMTGQVREHYLMNIEIAQRINRSSGGAVIAPWEVDQLSEEWISVFLMDRSIEGARNHQSEIEKRFAAFHERHKVM